MSRDPRMLLVQFDLPQYEPFVPFHLMSLTTFFLQVHLVRTQDSMLTHSDTLHQLWTMR